MPSPEEMAQGVNVDELEAHCFAAGPKYSKKAQVKEAGKDPSSPTTGIGTFFRQRGSAKGKSATF